VASAIERAEREAAAAAERAARAAAEREDSLRAQRDKETKGRKFAEAGRESDAARSRRTMEAAQAAVESGEAEIRQLRGDVAALQRQLAEAQAALKERTSADHGASKEVVSLRRELSEARLRAVALESELGRTQEALGDVTDRERALREEAEGLREAAADAEETMQGLMAHKDEQLAKVSAKLASLLNKGESFVDGRAEWHREMEALKHDAEEMRARLLARAEKAEEAVRVKLPKLVDELNAALAAKAAAEQRAKRAEDHKNGVQRTLKQSRRDIELLQMKVKVAAKPPAGPGDRSESVNRIVMRELGGSGRPAPEDSDRSTSGGAGAAAAGVGDGGATLPKLASAEGSRGAKAGLSWKPKR